MSKRRIAHRAQEAEKQARRLTKGYAAKLQQMQLGTDPRSARAAVVQLRKAYGLILSVARSLSDGIDNFAKGHRAASDRTLDQICEWLDNIKDLLVGDLAKVYTAYVNANTCRVDRKWRRTSAMPPGWSETERVRSAFKRKHVVRRQIVQKGAA